MNDEDITTIAEDEGGRKPAGQEAERLRAQMGEREDKMGQLQRELDRTAELVRSAEQERDSLRETSAAAESRSASLSESLAGAVAKYRESLLGANPDVPADMISGETIADIDASLEAARGLVARVRATVEEEARAATVPAGAPERTAPDLSSLSPREKIEYAIVKASKE